MEDKILKQIEEEAWNVFPSIDWHGDERRGFIQGAKFGYNIKENVDEKIIKAYREGYYNKSVGMQYLLDNEIIEAFNPPLSASQNTEKKESVGEKLTFIKHNNNLMQYAGFSYTKVNGVYGYLGIDGNDVIFIYSDERGVVKDVLDTHEIVVEPLSSKNTVSNEGDKWVSVNDRLPEAYETIISYNIHTDEVSTDYIDDEKRWDVLNPTHWMLLPNPPKEK